MGRSGRLKGCVAALGVLILLLLGGWWKRETRGVGAAGLPVPPLCVPHRVMHPRQV